MRVAAGVLLALVLAGLVALTVASVARGADDEAPCGPVVFTMPGRPDVRCGRLCWRPARGIWTWNRCRALYDRVSGTTPTPVATPGPLPTCPAGWCRGYGVLCIPCPVATPRPTPTPSGRTPCDRGEVGWCQTWLFATDTILCARCGR